MAFSMLALGLVGSMMVMGFIVFCGYALYDTLFNKEAY
ncbi:hypothetical protein JIPhKp127_0014 [Klebsiella phage JIPh_Kp127]|uniref:Uncharacterized protein n=1 Tax=Klebsiella phage JIPh_Kp127 TaxID=2653645 RepID=A0A5P8PLA5_9CAUD|nr:hypothetical protein JIPhKp127_0014 [Klebsiella phage JIPh_Kp127]